MRQRVLATLVAVAFLAFTTGTAFAGKVEVKGVHICCNNCIKAIGEVLGKVDGVSDAKCDKATMTVTFTGKDEKATKAALEGLFNAGFFGKATEDDKEVKVEVAAPKKGEKADEITVKGVHVCCQQCKTALTKLYNEAKVEFPAKNTITIKGKDLDKASVIESLRQAGFNGKIDSK